MTLTNDSMGFRMLLGRSDERTCSGRSRKQYLLGQPTSESLKELYQNSEKHQLDCELVF
jgi:ribosomal protein S6--L-glutamate ligase